MEESFDWRFSADNDPEGVTGINKDTYPYAILERLEKIAELLQQLLKADNEEGTQT